RCAATCTISSESGQYLPITTPTPPRRSARQARDAAGAGAGGSEPEPGMPMRIGLIADIHGNVFALDAVLAELRRDEVDMILCLGDVAVGAQPVEAVERISELGCRTIMGNWDDYVLDGLPWPPTEFNRRLGRME